MPRRATPEERHDIVARRLDRLSGEFAPPSAPEQDDEWWAAATRVRAPARHPQLPDQQANQQPDQLPGRLPGPHRDQPPDRRVGPAPSPFPIPGRHAAARPGLGLAARVPLTPAHLTIVAVLVAAGLAVTTWWVVRSDPEAPAPAPAPATLAEAPDLVEPAPAAVSEEAEATVTVDVAGRVRRPGIVVLDGGARVVDALERVGGPRPGVDLSTINLARQLIDGEQILVGLPGALVSPTLPGAAAPPGAPTALVDLNLASLEQLETLPDVGPVTAAAILAWRAEHGGFTAVTELLEVDGIGDVTLEKLTPLVTV